MYYIVTSANFFHSYLNWYSSANPLKKQPKLWKMVSSRAQKMFKKFIEPREDRRATNFVEISRYLDDRWMAKGYTDRVGKPQKFNDKIFWYLR